MRDGSLIHEGERLDDLGRKELQIIQHPGQFCFGMDAVLLSEFAKAAKGENCIDLCCGNGIIPILMDGRYEGATFTGLEIQEGACDLAKRSILYNDQQERISIVNGDLKEADKLFKAGSFDVVTCNPPYMTENHGIVNPEDAKAIARHEIKCSLEDVIAAAARLLKPKGRFYMVHRPFRLVDIYDLMRKYNLEPKRERLVYPFIDKEPNIVLIEGVRGSKARLAMEPPLIVYKEVNQFTDEIIRIYYE